MFVYLLQEIENWISCSYTQEIRRRGLKVAVVGIPKTIDNDIPVHFSALPVSLAFHGLFI